MNKDQEIKKGQIWKSKNSSVKLEIVSKFSGNKHWNTKKLGNSSKSHKIHEGTLLKFYELLTNYGK